MIPPRGTRVLECPRHEARQPGAAGGFPQGRQHYKGCLCWGCSGRQGKHPPSPLVKERVSPQVLTHSPRDTGQRSSRSRARPPAPRSPLLWLRLAPPGSRASPGSAPLPSQIHPLASRSSSRADRAPSAGVPSSMVRPEVTELTPGQPWIKIIPLLPTYGANLV